MQALRKQSLLFLTLALLVFSVNSHLHPLFHPHCEGGRPAFSVAVAFADDAGLFSADEAAMHPGLFCPFCHFGPICSDFDLPTSFFAFFEAEKTRLLGNTVSQRGQECAFYESRAPPAKDCTARLLGEPEMRKNSASRT